MRNFSNFLITTLVLLLTQIAINAQTTGVVSGMVTDPNGAVVSGATVTLKSDETGVDRSAVSNDKGSFTFASVQPGKYTVTVEAKGFKKAVASDVTVQVTKEVELTLAMEIGGTNETVNVS